MTGRGRWGQGTAVNDPVQARARLIEATKRCLVARGTTRLNVEDVAKEASVARSTVYRYFRTREELLLGVIIDRIDRSIEVNIRALRHPNDAGRSMIDLIVRSIALVKGDPINEALFADESKWLVTSLELSSEPVVDAFYVHLGPLLERWRDTGSLRADLDLRETTRWLNTIALLLLGPPWDGRSDRAKRQFLERYVVRALVTNA